MFRLLVGLIFLLEAFLFDFDLHLNKFPTINEHLDRVFSLINLLLHFLNLNIIGGAHVFLLLLFFVVQINQKQIFFSCFYYETVHISVRYRNTFLNTISINFRIFHIVKVRLVNYLTCSLILRTKFILSHKHAVIHCLFLPRNYFLSNCYW